MLTTIVDFKALFEVIWVSLAGGAGVTAAFSLVVFGAARSGELRREGHRLEAGAFGLLALVAFGAVAAAVALGIQIMVNK